MQKVEAITLIENKGPNNLRDELRNAFQKSSRVDIAVAFISLGGLNLILSSMTKFLARKNTKLRILTRISKDAFNEPGALKTFFDLGKNYEDRSELKAACIMNEFHQKMYLFLRGKSATVFIGSSDLTEKGLEREGEINARIDTPKCGNVYKQSLENFEENWNEANELNDEKIDTYASYFAHVHSRRQDMVEKNLWRKTSGTLRKRRAVKAPTSAKIKVRLDNVTGSVKDETEQTIKEYTNWDRYSYYSCGKVAYEKISRNDILIIADFGGRTDWLTANRVKSKTKTKQTPDGKYFIAYQPIRKSKRRIINNSLVRNLIDAEAIRHRKELKPSSARSLTVKMTRQFSRLLEIKTVRALTNTGETIRQRVLRYLTQHPDEVFGYRDKKMRQDLCVKNGNCINWALYDLEKNGEIGKIQIRNRVYFGCRKAIARAHKAGSFGA